MALSLPGTVWIAADIHLSDRHPATRRAFLAFLDRASVQADALLLCGDIFDAWIGDDQALQAPPAWLEELVQALQRTAAATPLWIGRGNRDFLIGDMLARHLGARLLPEEAILLTDAGRILLAHGDQYCTDDAGYQRFRRIVRNPLVQRLFLGLSLRLRRAVANWARRRSRAANRVKPAGIMDVNADAIAQAFRTYGVQTLVHGHTHRPAGHVHVIDGRPCLRHVLTDWDMETPGLGRQGWLQVDARGVQRMDSQASTTSPSPIRYQANGR